jgi:hypothetical protein
VCVVRRCCKLAAPVWHTFVDFEMSALECINCVVRGPMRELLCVRLRLNTLCWCFGKVSQQQRDIAAANCQYTICLQSVCCGCGLWL